MSISPVSDFLGTLVEKWKKEEEYRKGMELLNKKFLDNPTEEGRDHLLSLGDIQSMVNAVSWKKNSESYLEDLCKQAIGWNNSYFGESMLMTEILTHPNATIKVINAAFKFAFSENPSTMRIRGGEGFLINPCTPVNILVEIAKHEGSKEDYIVLGSESFLGLSNRSAGRDAYLKILQNGDIRRNILRDKRIKESDIDVWVELAASKSLEGYMKEVPSKIKKHEKFKSALLLGKLSTR